MGSTPRASAPAEQLIFLLGKRDIPADGVQDYCEYLGQALERRGVHNEIARVDWNSAGWLRALRKLRNVSRAWSGDWVVLQYTALAWSRRGFPFGAVIALSIARRRGARCAVVFHEPTGLSGPRWIDRIRAACQNWVVRKLFNTSERSIFPDPLNTIVWLPRRDQKGVFIPIGANIPDEQEPQENSAKHDPLRKTVAIFCLSDPPNLHRELGDISAAVKICTADGMKLRIVFFGRGTAEANEEIKLAFKTIPAEILNRGIQDANSVRRTLESSDVMLCVRGLLYPRRGSALAGIACGLPVIGYAGAAENTPITEAGVELVPYGDRTALGAALGRVLRDSNLWQQLHEKSLQAHRKYFSWGLIAEKFDEALFDSNTEPTGNPQVRIGG